MATAGERRAARTARLREARSKEEAEEARAAMTETLGEALAASLLRYLSTCAPERVMPIERAMAMIGYSEELKRLIVRCIETNPAMEESFLLIAELAYRDGEEAGEDKASDRFDWGA